MNIHNGATPPGWQQTIAFAQLEVAGVCDAVHGVEESTQSQQGQMQPHKVLLVLRNTGKDPCNQVTKLELPCKSAVAVGIQPLAGMEYNC